MYNFLIYKTYDELKKLKSNGTKLSAEQEIFLDKMKGMGEDPSHYNPYAQQLIDIKV